MIELFSFHLQGTPLFKDAEFRLARKGISVIHGRNLNTSNKNPNGAGKSFFFSQLPELIFGTPVVGNQKDRLRLGTSTLKLVKEEQGQRVKYEIIRSTNKGEKLTVVRNGKDLGIHKLADARSYVVNNIFGTNDAEFQTLCYLDTRVPHPLVLGDSGPRRAFFTRFFRLDTIDGLRRLVAQRLDEVRANKLLYSELARQYKERKEKLLEAEQLEKMQRWLKKAKALRTDLSEQLEKLSRTRTLLELRDSPMYSRLWSMCEEDFGNFEALKGFKNNDLQAAKTRLRVAEKYREHQQSVRDYKRAKAKVEEALQKLWGDDDVPPRKTVQLRLTSYEELSEKRDFLLAWSGKFEGAYLRLLEQRTQLRREIQQAKSRLEELASANTCPTCGQLLKDKKHLAHLAEQTQAQRTHTRELRRKLQDVEEKREALQAKQVKHTALKEKVEEELEGLSRYQRTITLLDRMPEKPEAFTGEKIDQEEEEARRAKLQADYDFLTSCESMLDSFQEAAALSTKSIAAAKASSDLSDQLSELSTRIARATLKLEQNEEAVAELEALRTRLKGMRQQILDEEAWLLLDDAFSKKGIQMLMIRSICNRLEQVINKYAKLVFPEDYRFSFDLDTQFNILVHRTHGKSVTVTDVRKLSGAESKLFSLLLLIGLMTFVPRHKRINVLILDEPTAAMGPEMAEAFAKFLPVLNKVIPHIVVITPRTEDRYEGAKVFTMVKKGNSAKIVEGAVA